MRTKFTVKQREVLQRILCLFVVLCPIFDVASFLFRNYFKTEVSISTFLRPIIPLIVGLFVFIKSNKKLKITLLITGFIYAVYAFVHYKVFNSLVTGCSYGNAINEMQYVFNFTFLIIDLIVYLCVFLVKNETPINNEKGLQILKKSFTIMLSIYIVSIILAIVTGTSSYTYSETSTGYKGWLESGNSASAVILLALFVCISQIDIKKIKQKWQIFNLITIVVTSIYMVTTMGTRTAMFGTFLAIGLWIVLEVLLNKNKKVFIIGLIGIILAGVGVGVFGSMTISRRKAMDEIASKLIDVNTGLPAHTTQDMIAIRGKILDGTIEEGYMSDAQKKATLELYDYANKHNLEPNDSRTQQLVYNVFLMKEQKNPVAFLFGNGYKTNYREMVMENEVAGIFINFGLIGFLLYLAPFLGLSIYFIVKLIKNTKLSKEKKQYLSNKKEYIYLLITTIFSLCLSWLSGHVFFGTSTMIVIVSVNIFILNEIEGKTNE